MGKAKTLKRIELNNVLYDVKLLRKDDGITMRIDKVKPQVPRFR